MRHLCILLTLYFLLHCTITDSTSGSDCEKSDNSVNSCKSSLCETELWLSQNGTIPGYHVLCIKKNVYTDTLDIEFYREGIADSLHSGVYTSSANTFSLFRKDLENILNIKLTDSLRHDIMVKANKPNPWMIYNVLGTPLIDINDMTGTLLVFENGIFIYPAIHIGFERNIIIKQKTFKLITLSVHPPVFQVLNFIYESDCDHIISISKSKMHTSGVKYIKNTVDYSKTGRSSSTHWLKKKDNIIKRIQVQCSELMHVSLYNQEYIQVLRYLPNEQYDSHWDYFDPQLYTGTEMEYKIRGNRNRFATIFWYLSTVEIGGWTYFPRSGNLSDPSSYKLREIDDCNVGLKVPPIKGSVILFYSMKPDGNVDPLSLHGACPVGENNIKWGANIWYWTKRVDPNDP